MLTVIIPVYKVPLTLDRCVSSVTEQSYRQLEILLVDDGSPDGCPQMCDRWAERDPRVRVIHKANGGLSSARNAALDVATSDFITFVDSDDYVGENTYADIMQRITSDVDIAEYPVWRFCGSRRQSFMALDNAEYSTPDDYWYKGRAYEHSYAWNKVYRRRVFNGVRFPVGKVFEDVYTLPLLLANARKVITVNTGIYYYCNNPDGITNTAGGAELRQLLMAHTDRYMPIRDERYYLHVLNIQLDVCAMTGDESVLNTLIIKHPWQQGFTNGLKLLFLNYAGLRRMCRLYRLKHRIKCFMHGKKLNLKKQTE